MPILYRKIVVRRIGSVAATAILVPSMVGCALFYETASYTLEQPSDGGSDSRRDVHLDSHAAESDGQASADGQRLDAVAESDGTAPPSPTLLASGEIPRGIVEASGSIYWVEGGANNAIRQLRSTNGVFTAQRFRLTLSVCTARMDACDVLSPVRS